MQPSPYPAAKVLSTECLTSDVAWPAIIGGAFGAIALSLILSPLGVALGFAPAFQSSPWPLSEPGKALSVTSAIWLIIVQWVSSGLGGYLTGRLRTKWAGAHTHEVFFRDTVHGFLAWALATVVGALLLMTVAAQLMGHSMETIHHDTVLLPSTYDIESLFRNDQANAPVTDQDRREAAHILATGLITDGSLSDNDKTYLSHLVAARTALSEQDAEKRVDTLFVQQKVRMDSLRKASVITSLFVTLSLLIGAFIACVAGALGGYHRDVHYTTGSLDESRLI